LGAENRASYQQKWRSCSGAEPQLLIPSERGLCYLRFYYKKTMAARRSNTSTSVPENAANIFARSDIANGGILQESTT
jgi:hypothetical protein